MRQEILGEFLDLPEWWDEAVKILCTAAVNAENFDRSLPHVEGPGGDALVFPEHRQLSQRHARECYEEAARDLVELGLSEAQRREVRHHVFAMPSSAQAHHAGLKLRPLHRKLP